MKLINKVRDFNEQQNKPSVVLELKSKINFEREARMKYLEFLKFAEENSIKLATKSKIATNRTFEKIYYTEYGPVIHEGTRHDPLLNPDHDYFQGFIDYPYDKNYVQKIYANIDCIGLNSMNCSYEGFVINPKGAVIKVSHTKKKKDPNFPDLDQLFLENEASYEATYEKE